MYEHISTWPASRLDIVLWDELVQPTSTKGTVFAFGINTTTEKFCFVPPPPPTPALGTCNVKVYTDCLN